MGFDNSVKWHGYLDLQAQIPIVCRAEGPLSVHLIPVDCICSRVKLSSEWEDRRVNGSEHIH